MSSVNSKIRILFILSTFFFGYLSFGQKTGNLAFVQLCDTQLGMGGYEHDKNTFAEAVTRINALHPDFVIICGDLVNIPADSSYADFKKIMKRFTMPCFCVPGNHDVGNSPTALTVDNYRKIIGKDYYTFDKRGYHFIGLNTQLWKAYAGQESLNQDNWFKETLKKLAKKKNPVIVFGHIPLFLSDPREKEVYSNFPPKQRNELMDLMEKSHVIAYLSGHSHTLIINDYRGIKLVSGETTSNNFDKRPFGFRLWKVSSDSVRHEFISIVKASE